MSNPTTETTPEQDPELLCRWPADGSHWSNAHAPRCENLATDEAGGALVYSPPGIVVGRGRVCAIHRGAAYYAGWRDVPKPTEPEGLTLNGINVALCKAFGVDDAKNAGFRLTVLGGEFPALEVFQLPPQDEAGMFSAEPVQAVDHLVGQGARIAPPHLVLTEFTLAKLLEASGHLQNALATSRRAGDGGPSVVDMAPVLMASAAISAGLSGWAEAGSPAPAVVKVTGVVDEDGQSVAVLEDGDATLPAGELVEVYAVPVNRPDADEPSLAEHDEPEPPTSRAGHTGLVTERPATYRGFVHDGADDLGPVPPASPDVS